MGQDEVKQCRGVKCRQVKCGSPRRASTFFVSRGIFEPKIADLAG